MIKQILRLHYEGILLFILFMLLKIFSLTANSLTFTNLCLTPPSHNRPWPLCGSLPSTTCYWVNFSPYHFSFLVYSTHIYLPMKMEQSVPKCWHINSRCRGITQKKTHNFKFCRLVISSEDLEMTDSSHDNIPYNLKLSE